jgi:hypothetical protein
VLRLAASYPIFRAIDGGEYSPTVYIICKGTHSTWNYSFRSFLHCTALQGNGLKIMILLRLSPLIPYNALDYMSGVTAIPLWDYSLALIGILPGTIMFCFVGASASSLADSTQSGNETVRILSIVFGITFAVIGVTVASYYSKLELDRVSIALQYAVNFASLSKKSLTLWCEIRFRSWRRKPWTRV